MPVQALPNMDSLTPSKASCLSLLALVQASSNLNTQAIQVRDSSKASNLRNNRHSTLDTLSETSSPPRTSFLSNSLFRLDSLLSSKSLRRRQVKPPLK